MEVKVLIVASGNYADPYKSFSTNRTFIHDQIMALQNYNNKFDLFLIEGKGISGYCKQIFKLRNKIIKGKYDLVHAHYGISGLLAVLSSPRPVIITFHGSDINNRFVNLLSSAACILSAWNIYVSSKLFQKSLLKPKRHSIIPCGVDFEIFYPEDKQEIRKKLGIDKDKKYVLFASSFANPVKNFPLATQAIKMLTEPIEIKELKNMDKTQVRDYLNAADLLLMTSFSEGSPQVIKEAMACNCPIVTTEVGDVKLILGATEGCYITSYNPDDVAVKISQALKFAGETGKTKGRQRIIELGFASEVIAKKITEVYREILTAKEIK